MISELHYGPAQEEMNVLSSLKHPNIIRLIEIHFLNNIFFLVMVGVKDAFKERHGVLHFLCPSHQIRHRAGPRC